MDKIGVDLDDVSKAILDELRQDGRRSYAAIGRAIGRSAVTVQKRIQDLIDRKLVRVVAVTALDTFGFTRKAMIGVRVEGEVDPIADSLAGMSEVSSVVFTAGSFDLFAEVTCQSDEHLSDLLARRIRRIENVVSTETFMYLRFHKHSRARRVT
jgi:Lrp/AsnC family transcriptional regulator for asnA, asnC and gidA